MKAVIPGHSYELQNLKSQTKTLFNFFMDPQLHNGKELDGPSCQEVIRMLIDRVQYLETEKHWERNKEIIQHLRKALLLFEFRALELKVEKGVVQPEKIFTSLDGHFNFLSEITNKGF